MDKKVIRAIWYSIAATFFLIGAFTDKIYIFPLIGGCCIVVGNIRSRKL